MQTTEHHRQSYRLRYHNYAETRAYHITICSRDRALIFGDVIDATMHLSTIGKIIEEEIQKTATMRSGGVIDAHVVMPNHVHLILILTEASDAPAPRGFEAPHSGTISSIINGLKAACTSRVRKELRMASAVIWQSRFFDRVIRDEEELMRTRQYIQDNPGKWQDDHDNPANFERIDRQAKSTKPNRMVVVRQDASHSP